MKVWIKKIEIQLVILTVLGLGLLALLSHSPAKDTQASTQEEPFQGVDTYIPSGHVLIPIEIANAESLGSLIGSSAVVDLYTMRSEDMRRGKKIASRIKLVRAPLNPQLFAVLVRENESSFIMNQNGPFWVTLQNRTSTESVLQGSAKKFQPTPIEYLND